MKGILEQFTAEDNAISRVLMWLFDRFIEVATMAGIFAIVVIFMLAVAGR